MEMEILPKLSSSMLQQHLLKFQQIGNKWPGTQGETETRDYIHEQMQSYGLETRVEEFDYLKWSPISTSVKIKSPAEKEVKCAPVSYYANKEAEGELVYVGSGSKLEFEALIEAGSSLEGKILIAISDGPFMISPLVEKYGAVGLITISDAVEDLIRRCAGAFYATTATPTLPKNPRDFPAQITGAMIPMSEGHRLLSLMSTGKVRVNIVNYAEYSLGKSWNVIGEIEGSEQPEEKVILGGHYDTEFITPGIWDNGTGTAGLLEIARSVVKSDINLERSIIFTGFSCEENGLWGSVDYIKKHESKLKKNCSAFFNLDVPSGAPITGHSLWVSDSIRDFAVEIAEILGWKLDIVEGVEVTFSDYAPFRDIGVPNAWFWEYPPIHPYYHTWKDTIEFAVNLRDLVRSLEVIALSATKLATTAHTL